MLALFVLFLATVRALRLEGCARTIGASFRESCFSSLDFASSLDTFVASSVDALLEYDVNLIQLEIEVHDDQTTRLTETERRFRRQWLLAIRHTLDQLIDDRPEHVRSAEDVEMAAFVHSVVQQQNLNTGIQLDRALAMAGRHSSPMETTRGVPPHLVPLSQIVLLTMRTVWQLEADDLYPGATG